MMVLKPWEMAMAKHSVMRSSNLHGQHSTALGWVSMQGGAVQRQCPSASGQSTVALSTQLQHRLPAQHANAVLLQRCVISVSECITWQYLTTHLLMTSFVNFLQGPPPLSL
jgi:hypothetical protein